MLSANACILYNRRGVLQGKARFTELQAAFAAVVKKRLQCRATSAPFEAVQQLKEVLAKADTPAAMRAHGRVADVWNVLQRQHARWAAAGGPSLPAAGAQVALLKGSLEHLETEYFEHMQVRALPAAWPAAWSALLQAGTSVFLGC